jgi:hypothetical protein
MLLNPFQIGELDQSAQIRQQNLSSGCLGRTTSTGSTPYNGNYVPYQQVLELLKSRSQTSGSASEIGVVQEEEETGSDLSTDEEEETVPPGGITAAKRYRIVLQDGTQASLVNVAGTKGAIGARKGKQAGAAAAAARESRRRAKASFTRSSNMTLGMEKETDKGLTQAGRSISTKEKLREAQEQIQKLHAILKAGGGTDNLHLSPTSLVTESTQRAEEKGFWAKATPSCSTRSRTQAGRTWEVQEACKEAQTSHKARSSSRSCISNSRQPCSNR